MTGESKFNSTESVSVLERPTWLVKSSRWSISLFVLAGALLFGGVAGDWFAADLAGGSLVLRSLQMSAGVIGMALLVAVPGSLVFGRNPIRWGIGMPFLVYLGGTLLALVSGKNDAMTLLYGAPLFLGLAFAAGVLSTYLIDGIFARGQRD